MENGRIFQQLIPGIVEIYGDLLVSVILYGPVARGTQTEASDIDIAVMLRSEENADMKERITDLIVNLELEHNKVISVLRIDYEKFKMWEETMPFYKDIKDDGIILWQADDDVHTDTKSETKEIFCRLEQLRRKGTVGDDGTELASYREVKYGKIEV